MALIISFILRVMEQQPGPVNWAPFNPAPLPGAVHLWSMEAFAHGAEVVSYFRWKQCPFAQEQYHAGMQEILGDEIPLTREKLAEWKEYLQPAIAQVAIYFDYPSAWAYDVQPQGQTFDYFQLILAVYRALRQMGLAIDIVSRASTLSDLGKYSLIFIPAVFELSPVLEAALKAERSPFPALIFGPRAPAFLRHVQLTLPRCVESLRPGASIPLEGGGCFERWFEPMALPLPPEQFLTVRSTAAGLPALMSCYWRKREEQPQTYYLNGWPCRETMLEMCRDLCESHSVGPLLDLPVSLRVQPLIQGYLLLHYGSEEICWGGIRLPPAAVHYIPQLPSL